MTEQELFTKAVIFAAQKHHALIRRDGSPYIYHPLHVADLVRTAGFGLKYQIVAILHDVLEDTDATREEVAFFGDDVLHSVTLLTRTPGVDEADYVAAILKDPMAAAVKHADKLHNMTDCIHAHDERWVRRYIAKARTYYYGKFSKELDELIELREKM